MIIIKNLVLLAILIHITITDIQRQEIDNEPLLVGLFFIGLFMLTGLNNVSVQSSIGGFLIAGIFFTLLGLFGTMGGGDIKLFALIGLFLGWKLTILAMYTSFLIGALLGIILLITKRGKKKDFMAFGPAIAIGSTITMFYGPYLINTFDLLHFLR